MEFDGFFLFGQQQFSFCSTGFVEFKISDRQKLGHGQQQQESQSDGDSFCPTGSFCPTANKSDDK